MLYANKDTVRSIDTKKLVAQLRPVIVSALAANPTVSNTDAPTCFFNLYDTLKQSLSLLHVSPVFVEAIAQTVSLTVVDADYSLGRVITAVESLLDVEVYVREAVLAAATDNASSYDQILVALRAIRKYASSPLEDSNTDLYDRSQTKKSSYSVLEALERLQGAHQGRVIGIAQCEPLSALTAIVLNMLSDIIPARVEVLNVREDLPVRTAKPVDGHSRLAVYCLDLNPNKETPVYLDISATHSNLGHVVLKKTGKKYNEESLQEFGQKSLKFPELLIDLWALRVLINTEEGIAAFTRAEAEQWFKKIESVLQYTDGFNKTIWPNLRLLIYVHDLVLVEDRPERLRRLALYEKLTQAEYEYMKTYDPVNAPGLLAGLAYVRECVNRL